MAATIIKQVRVYRHYGLVDYINKGLQIGLIPSWACSRYARGLHEPKKNWDFIKIG